MGTVFAHVVGPVELITADPQLVTSGMRTTFAGGGRVIVAAIGVALTVSRVPSENLGHHV